MKLQVCVDDNVCTTGGRAGCFLGPLRDEEVTFVEGNYLEKDEKGREEAGFRKMMKVFAWH